VVAVRVTGVHTVLARAVELPMSNKRIPPAPGQESVWDYPRPPLLERSDRRIEIWFGGEKIADSRQTWRVLETSHPPVYYIPASDIGQGVLRHADGTSFCEWKGTARYFDVVTDGQSAVKAAWSYPDPTEPFASIAGHVAFYPAQMDVCRIDGVDVQPQPGGFYGGWVTPEIVGPYKGEPGTSGW